MTFYAILLVGRDRTSQIPGNCKILFVIIVEISQNALKKRAAISQTLMRGHDLLLSIYLSDIVVLNITIYYVGTITIFTIRVAITIVVRGTR